MRAPNMFDRAVQTNKTSPIKHENKRNVLSCLIECLMPFKFYQTRSNSTKQGGQTVKCLVTKQCLMVFGHQTFPVWTGLKISISTHFAPKCSSRTFNELLVLDIHYYSLQLFSKISFFGERISTFRNN